jgi:ABC-type dipeptide/oligopeptide/nickel transport system permease subunit
MKKFFLNKSYKQKNKFLLIGFVLVLLILWFAVFKNTYTLYKECSNFDAQLQIAEQAPQKNKALLIQLDELDQKLKNQQRTDTNIQQAIFQDPIFPIKMDTELRLIP